MVRRKQSLFPVRKNFYRLIVSKTLLRYFDFRVFSEWQLERIILLLFPYLAYPGMDELLQIPVIAKIQVFHVFFSYVLNTGLIIRVIVYGVVVDCIVAIGVSRVVVSCVVVIGGIDIPSRILQLAPYHVSF